MHFDGIVDKCQWPSQVELKHKATVPESKNSG